MELTYLYYFKVIAEKENMSRAAETLHVSQPALSKTISKLEDSLGVTLFERKRGRISLSPIGSDFYHLIAKAFDSIDEAQRLIDAYKTTSSSSVTIASPVAELMNSLLRNYLIENPTTPLQISQFLYPPELLQDQLLSGRLDFALTPIPLQDHEINQIKLMEEEILLVVGRGHPLYGQRFVKLSDCANEHFLVNDASFDHVAVIDNCKAVGFTPNITICSNEPGIISETLESGHGVSMVPANVFYQKYAHYGPVCAMRFLDIEVFRFLSIVTRRDHTLQECAKQLYTYAVNYFKQYEKELNGFLDDYFPPMEMGPRVGLGLHRNINS